MRTYDTSWGRRPRPILCSPPIRERGNQERCGGPGDRRDVHDRHRPRPFQIPQPDDLPPQKPHGRGYFTKVPNGVPGIEERLMVI